MKRLVSALFLVAFATGALTAQVSVRESVIPRLIRFGGVVRDADGKPLTGVVGVTFSLYKDQAGGAPLWMEVQNVTTDSKGHYSALLGSTKEDGIPSDIFVSGEAQWLGVRAENQEELPRVLLVSVPYALKAADADTLGGKPASAFMQSTFNFPDTTTSTLRSATKLPQGLISGNAFLRPRPNLAGSGTTNYIPIWTDNNGTLGNSQMYQNGRSIGLGTTTPAAQLTVLNTATNTTNTLLGLGYFTTTLTGNRQLWMQQWLNSSTARQFLVGNGYVSGTTSATPNNGPYTSFEALEFQDSYFGFVWNKSGSITPALTISPTTGTVQANIGIDHNGTGIKHVRSTASCTTGKI